LGRRLQKSKFRGGDDCSLVSMEFLASGCSAATPRKRDDVSNREFHKVWMDQCEAAEDIRLRYGLKAAFDYVVAEKLLMFAEAAARRPEFAARVMSLGVV